MYNWLEHTHIYTSFIFGSLQHSLVFSAHYVTIQLFSYYMMSLWLSRRRFVSRVSLSRVTMECREGKNKWIYIMNLLYAVPAIGDSLYT